MIKTKNKHDLIHIKTVVVIGCVEYQNNSYKQPQQQEQIKANVNIILFCKLV